MIHYVLDASSVVDLCVAADPSWSLREALGFDQCVTAEVFDLDAAALLGRLVEGGALPETDAGAVLLDIRALPVHRVSHAPLIGRVWALRRELNACDAVYLALAEALGVPLLTSNAQLQEVAGRRRRAAQYR